jgi:hypothetical protein
VNIYGLKGLIKALETENKTENLNLLQFYKDLYKDQLEKISAKIINDLEKEQKEN